MHEGEAWFTAGEILGTIPIRFLVDLSIHLPPSGPKTLSQVCYTGEEEMSRVFRAYSELALY